MMNRFSRSEGGGVIWGGWRGGVHEAGSVGEKLTFCRFEESFMGWHHCERSSP